MSERIQINVIFINYHLKLGWKFRYYLYLLKSLIDHKNIISNKYLLNTQNSKSGCFMTYFLILLIGETENRKKYNIARQNIGPENNQDPYIVINLFRSYLKTQKSNYS